MNSSAFDRIIEEWGCLRVVDDAELAALTTAILIEDAFDVVLTDEELGTDLRRDPDGLRVLLDHRPSPT